MARNTYIFHAKISITEALGKYMSLQCIYVFADSLNYRWKLWIIFQTLDIREQYSRSLEGQKHICYKRICTWNRDLYSRLLSIADSALVLSKNEGIANYFLNWYFMFLLQISCNIMQRSTIKKITKIRIKKLPEEFCWKLPNINIMMESTRKHVN